MELKRIRFGIRGTMALALAALALGFGSCSSKDIRDAAVASVNGDEVKVGELREFLGFRGGAVAATGVPAEKKKEALDRLVAGRLLAQDARGRGIDNTDEYRKALARNEAAVWIGALIRKETAAKLKVRDEEVQAEAKKLREADKNLSEADAGARAAQTVAEAQVRKIEQDLVAAARKEFPATVDREMMQRIGKGESLPDNAVLAVVGEGKVTYGEVLRQLQAAMPGGHLPAEAARNPAVVEQAIDREATARSLEAYARKQGLEGSEILKSTRRELERSIAISLEVNQVVSGVGGVTDKEISDTYAEHAQMFVRDGKKIPLSQVKEQIRQFLLDSKRRKALEAHIDELKKKAKITIDDGMLSKV
jgi:hypothetical protein